MVSKEVDVKADIIEKDKILMRTNVGEVITSVGNKYVVGFHSGRKHPIITMPDGEKVSFEWKNLIKAARNALND